MNKFSAPPGVQTGAHQRIAFVTKNWLGDILMQTPAIHALRENFPEAEITGFVPERCHQVLRGNPDVDRLVSFHEKENIRGIFRQINFISKTRRRKFDRVYLFHRSFSRAMLFAWAGARRRIGYATKGRAWLLTDPIAEPKTSMHQTDYFLELLSKSGLNVSDNMMNTRFYPSPSDREKAAGLIREFGISGNFILIHVGANWTPKRWFPEYHAQLSNYFNRSVGADILLSGSSSDSALAKEVAKLSKNPAVKDLTGQTSFGVLGAICEGARLVVSGDSGPMHLAASVGAPLLALFVATDGALTGPRGLGPAVIVQKRSAIRVPEAYEKKNNAVHLVEEVNPAVVIQIIEKTNLLDHHLAYATGNEPTE